MFQYRPERIIIDQAVSAEPLTEQICERFPEVPRTVVENFAWHQDESGTDPLRNPLTQGKKTFISNILREHRSRLVLVFRMILSAAIILRWI